jgi:hypothetical protein
MEKMDTPDKVTPNKEQSPIVRAGTVGRRFKNLLQVWLNLGAFWLLIGATGVLALRPSWIPPSVIAEEKIQKAQWLALLVLAVALSRGIFALHATLAKTSLVEVSKSVAELRKEVQALGDRMTTFFDAEALTNVRFRDGVFEKMTKVVRRKDTADKPITIDLIGVSMHWTSRWLLDLLEAALVEKDDLRIDLRIVFVSPELLLNLQFSDAQVDWPKESLDRCQWLRTEFPKLIKRHNGRLRLVARLTNNLPHWHGILIERECLYLGRVSWLDNPERHYGAPKELTCAGNGYRLYERDDAIGGSERIRLFRRWCAHYCYGSHDGEWLWRPMRCSVASVADGSFKFSFPEFTGEFKSEGPLDARVGDVVEIDLNTPNVPQVCRNVTQSKDFAGTVLNLKDNSGVLLKISPSRDLLNGSKLSELVTRVRAAHEAQQQSNG